MALEHAADPAQVLHLIKREITTKAQSSVKCRGSVTFAQDKPVPVRPLRIFRIMLHVMEIENGDNVCHGQRPTRMARPSLKGRLDDLDPDPAGVLLKLGN